MTGLRHGKKTGQSSCPSHDVFIHLPHPDVQTGVLIRTPRASHVSYHGKILIVVLTKYLCKKRRWKQETSIWISALKVFVISCLWPKLDKLSSTGNKIGQFSRFPNINFLANFFLLFSSVGLEKFHMRKHLVDPCGTLSVNVTSWMPNVLKHSNKRPSVPLCLLLLQYIKILYHIDVY